MWMRGAGRGEPETSRASARALITIVAIVAGAIALCAAVLLAEPLYQERRSVSLDAYWHEHTDLPDRVVYQLVGYREHWMTFPPVEGLLQHLDATGATTVPITLDITCSRYAARPTGRRLSQPTRGVCQPPVFRPIVCCESYARLHRVDDQGNAR
jgi:hypothetical protein